MKYRILACLVFTIALGAPTLVGAQGSRDPGAVAALKERQAKVTRQRSHVATKPSAADRRELRELDARVRKLIERLEAGEAVSAQEIDEAFGLSNR